MTAPLYHTPASPAVPQVSETPRVVAPEHRAVAISIDRALPWLVAALAVVVGYAIIDALPVGVVHDDGMYVILAKSLATGHGYSWLHVPGAPPATHFPPGYPFFLALLWKLAPNFPANVLLFKIANVVFVGLAAAGATVFAQRRLGFPPLTAAAIAVAGSIGIPVLLLSSMVMSEPMFLALLFPLLLLAERVADGERRIPVLVAAGLAAGAATLVRTHGIALVGALGLVLLSKRRVRDAVVYGLSAAVVMLPWQLWVRAHEGFVPAAMRGNYESYTGWLVRGLREEGAGLVARTLVRTSRELTGMFATFAAFGMSGVVRVTALVVLAALMIMGLRRLWRLAPVTTLFLLLYSAIVLLWPFAPTRFIWGLWPLVLCVPAAGVAQLWNWRPQPAALRALRFAAVGGAAFLVVNYARATLKGYENRWWSSIPRAQANSLRSLIMWVRASSRPTDVIVSNAEPVVYLYAGRASLPATSFTVRDYFGLASVRESEDALRGVLGAYHADVVAVVALDSLVAAARAMATGPNAQLAMRDSFPNGFAFTPIRK